MNEPQQPSSSETPGTPENQEKHPTTPFGRELTEPSNTFVGEQSAFSEFDGTFWPTEEFEEAEHSARTDVGRLPDEVSTTEEAKAARSGSNPVSLPLSVVALFGAVVLWAGLYLGLYSSGFSSTSFNYKPGASAGPPPKVDPRAVGQKLFAANCALCHQLTGMGIPGQFPPLVASEWVIGNAPNRLIQIVEHGLQGTVHVKSQAYNGQMPPWGPQFSDEQLASILTYIRSEWGNNAPAISKEEVAASRKQIQRSDPWTEHELLQIAEGPIEGVVAKPAAPPKT